MNSASIYSSLLLILSILLLSQACSPKTVSRSSTRPATKSGVTKEAKIVATAHQHLGSSYKYGGNGPRSFDCSGLIQQVFLANNIQLPRTSSAQSKIGRSISIGQVSTGDLLFFTKNKNGGGINHVALVVKAGTGGIWVIHSTTSKGVIKEDIRKSTYWQDRLQSARRIN